VALSAGCCLASVSLLLRNEILEPILSFVSNNMANPNWKQRYAALLSLGAIVEGPEKMKFMQIIQTAITPLINMFNDPN
jgi:importin subunit beta-1